VVINDAEIDIILRAHAFIYEGIFYTNYDVRRRMEEREMKSHE
jgi:hypothetical protein